MPHKGSEERCRLPCTLKETTKEGRRETGYLVLRKLYQINTKQAYKVPGVSYLRAYALLADQRQKKKIRCWHVIIIYVMLCAPQPLKTSPQSP